MAITYLNLNKIHIAVFEKIIFFENGHFRNFSKNSTGKTTTRRVNLKTDLFIPCVNLNYYPLNQHAPTHINEVSTFWSPLWGGVAPTSNLTIFFKT